MTYQPSIERIQPSPPAQRPAPTAAFVVSSLYSTRKLNQCASPPPKSHRISTGTRSRSSRSNLHPAAAALKHNHAHKHEHEQDESEHGESLYIVPSTAKRITFATTTADLVASGKPGLQFKRLILVERLVGGAGSES
ncbi:hypothetical protein PLICRDRAFT_42661 [Plicaturopsis crispa FD-325 SS-3]|nr:hypothetical protein PLICRDRAFT_42661 [Plicaturopsis crispa FD-325 SS-3]